MNKKIRPIAGIIFSLLIFILVLWVSYDLSRDYIYTQFNYSEAKGKILAFDNTPKSSSVYYNYYINGVEHKDSQTLFLTFKDLNDDIIVKYNKNKTDISIIKDTETQMIIIFILELFVLYKFAKML